MTYRGYVIQARTRRIDLETFEKVMWVWAAYVGTEMIGMAASRDEALAMARAEVNSVLCQDATVLPFRPRGISQHEAETLGEYNLHNGS